MKVKVTKIGFYGKLRKIGEEFDIENEKAFSSSWMEKVKVKSKKKTKE